MKRKARKSGRKDQDFILNVFCLFFFLHRGHTLGETRGDHTNRDGIIFDRLNCIDQVSKAMLLMHPSQKISDSL